MQKRKKCIAWMLFMAIVCSATIGNVQRTSAASTKVTKAVNYARKIYYGTNKKLKKYTKGSIKGSYKEYWNKKKLVKAITYPKASSAYAIKGYTVEYYYDDHEHLVFAYAYHKVKGKLQELRAYYAPDQKMYRYIDAKGTIWNYSQGRSYRYNVKDMRDLLFHKGEYYKALAHEGIDNPNY